MVNRNEDTSSYQYNSENYSSDSKSILTIDNHLENKKSTCSSEDEGSSPISNQYDTMSMVTISSSVSKNIKKTIQNNPIEEKKCACSIS